MIGARCSNPDCRLPLAKAESVCISCGWLAETPAEAKDPLLEYCVQVMADGCVDETEVHELAKWLDRVDAAKWEACLRTTGISPDEVRARIQRRHGASPGVQLEWRCESDRPRAGQQLVIAFRMSGLVDDKEATLRVSDIGAGPAGRPIQHIFSSDDAAMPRRCAFKPANAGQFLVNCVLETPGVSGESVALEGDVVVHVHEPIKRSKAPESPNVVVKETIGPANVTINVGAGDAGEPSGMQSTQPWARCELRRHRSGRGTVLLRGPAPQPCPNLIQLAVDGREESWILQLGSEMIFGNGLPGSEADTGIAALFPDIRRGDPDSVIDFVSRKALTIGVSSITKGIDVRIDNLNGGRVAGTPLSQRESASLSLVPGGRAAEIQIGRDVADATIAVHPLGRSPLADRLEDMDCPGLGPETAIAGEARRSGLGGLSLEVRCAGRVARIYWLLDGLDATRLGIPGLPHDSVFVHRQTGPWLLVPVEGARGRFDAWPMARNGAAQLRPSLTLRTH